MKDKIQQRHTFTVMTIPYLFLVVETNVPKVSPFLEK